MGGRVYIFIVTVIAGSGYGAQVSRIVIKVPEDKLPKDIETAYQEPEYRKMFRKLIPKSYQGPVIDVALTSEIDDIIEVK